MKYIICGLAPGSGYGVPKLLEYLDDRLNQSKYTMLYPKVYNFRNKYLRWFVNKISKTFFFPIRLAGIKNKNIVLMHHQSITSCYWIEKHLFFEHRDEPLLFH